MTFSMGTRVDNCRPTRAFPISYDLGDLFAAHLPKIYIHIKRNIRKHN